VFAWLKKRKHKRVNKKHKARRRNVVWLANYKITCSCLQCGESHPACLEFHHRDPNKKKMTISGAVRRGWSLKRLKREIEKCDVLCANCHRKIHNPVEVIYAENYRGIQLF
jgi:hypothetical protein